MIPRIEDVKGEPVIGRHYLVPCILYARTLWFPILGSLHEDKEILDFDSPHYHFDFRFVGKRQLNHWRCRYSMGHSDDVVLQSSMIRVQTAVDTVANPIKRLRLACRRQMPEFPMRVLRLGGFIYNTMQQKLERAFRDKRMTCATCPHRGFKLDQLPQKNGVVVCPGHGLAWNMQTGEMVSRL